MRTKVAGLTGAICRDPRPAILLAVVIGWSLVLFFAYGLSSHPNAISLVMTALGAIAVASALLLIFDLMDPYDGLFRIPPDGINHVLAAIGALVDFNVRAPSVSPEVRRSQSGRST
jgi:hypothetical protein